MPTSRAGTWNNRAFTLIELVIVIVIVALLATVVTPRLKAMLSHGDTNKAIRQIRGMVRYVAGMSAATGSLYRLHFDLDQRLCWVGRPNKEGEIIKEQELLTRPLHLPTGVKFQDISTPRGVSKEGVTYTDFFPSGWVEETLIHVEGGVVVTIKFLPVTGEVKVFEGYVTEAAR
jgi:prepilin-type N-terminal cleavage/methylation domain-containing protein